ncbi:MAG: hypothetical protein QS721_03575 [Candidatus Endonucleobacter sp. (ex Gigantidas childressi)]|nr:hypothetical protein [Candidatus Endonucleobacter sp. (ex Gigantidas childressi)]
MLSILQSLGVRPRASDDNPYSKDIFITLKLWPGYPLKPFTDVETVRN